MTWFRVDDTLPFHAKVVAAGNAAMGLWVRAGAWSAQQLTDGFIPTHMVAALGNTRQAGQLVAADLWETVEGGFRFHGWNDEGRQPTREQVENKREQARERMRSVRANSERSSGAVTPTPSRPVLSRPAVVEVPSRLSLADATPVDNCDDELDLDKIKTYLRCDEAWAAKVALDVIGRSSDPVRDPTAYVLNAIGREPKRYQPTPTPPRYLRRGATA
jgi:hypothetical protein